MRLGGVILTGIVALLLFDRFTGGGGVMAGLVAGLLGALGGRLGRVDTGERAERERESRIFVIVKPDGLSPRLGGLGGLRAVPGLAREHDVRREPSPFDLEI